MDEISSEREFEDVYCGLKQKRPVYEKRGGLKQKRPVYEKRGDMCSLSHLQ